MYSQQLGTFFDADSPTIQLEELAKVVELPDPILGCHDAPDAFFDKPQHLLRSLADESDESLGIAEWRLFYSVTALLYL